MVKCTKLTSRNFDIMTEVVRLKEEIGMLYLQATES
jgi:hypothetical protein